MHMYVYAVSAYVEAREDIRSLLCYSVTYLLETGLSLRLKLTVLACWSQSSRDLPVSPAFRFQVCVAMPGFLCGR